MKPDFRLSPHFFAIVATGLLSVTLVAWNHVPAYQARSLGYSMDTVPAVPSKQSGLRDLDKELKKLDHAIERLESLQSTHLDKISSQVSEHLIRSTQKRCETVEQSLKAIDGQDQAGSTESFIRNYAGISKTDLWSNGFSYN